MAETFTEKSSNGSLNSTTPVTIVAAPSGLARRVIRTMTIYNKDTVSATVTVSLVDSGGSTSIIFKGTLSSGDTWVWSQDVIDLDGTTKSITAVLSGAVTTSQPEYTTHYSEVTD